MAAAATAHKTTSLMSAAEEQVQTGERVADHDKHHRQLTGELVALGQQPHAPVQPHTEPVGHLLGDLGPEPVPARIKSAISGRHSGP